VRLIKRPLELGAIKYFTEVGHHRTAIEAAVQYVREGFARSAENANDLLVSELSPILCEWVIETIYQGAYLREFHLWEKTCKEYFSPKDVNMKPSKSVAFTDHVKGVLSSEFALTVPDDVIAALSTMRCKVNRMKHESGVQDEEFISAAEYEAAVATIEQFWEFLEENEHVSNSNDAP